MSRPAKLETFELIAGGAASTPSDDWVAGHAAGLADGIAHAKAEESALSDALVQTLSDMSFGYHEARGHLLAALAPFFEQLIETFVPRFGQEMLVPQIAGALSEIAGRSLDMPIALSVAPAQLDAVTDKLRGIGDLPFDLRPDPSLSGGQVLFQTGNGERLLDVDALIARSQTVLSSLLDASQKRSDHG